MRFTAATVATVIAASSAVSALAPLKTTKGKNAKPIANKYIVVLHPEAKNTDSHVNAVKQLTEKHNAAAAAKALKTPGGSGDLARPAIKNEVHTVWKDGFSGYVATLTPEALTELRNMPEVKFVEQDGVVSINNQQSGAPWGLGRISSRNAVSNPATYFYDGSAGAGVKIFVVDTGIRTTHSEFGGRATWGANFAGDGQNYDGNGHGTHVSGTSAGATYGVAKKANLVAVKVLNAQGSGSNSGVISGINWVAQQHKAGKGGAKGSVINMSLGGGYSSAVNSAAEAAVAAGVHLAVAAGNSADDACSYSPASANGVLSVAASDVNDNFADFSNYGSCTSIIGPGVNVLSAWNTGDSATNTISGTSMATPHAAGTLAYYLGLSSTSYTPAALISKVVDAATPDAINSIPDWDTPNKMLYNSYQ